MRGMKLPETYEIRMKSLLGEEYPAYLQSLEEPETLSLHINTGKISAEEFRRISPFELSPVPWCADAFYVHGDVRPGTHPYWYAGLYYLQEASASLPAEVLPVQPGDRVLDACAAPGGKTVTLAAKLQDTGVLISNDISISRQNATLKNIQRYGAGNTYVTGEDLNRMAEHFPEYFDCILLDVPCSGEGMFRKDPSLIKAWEERGPQYYAEIQKEIVTSALGMLREGGKLVYSTCTFSPEEDEEIILYMKKICPQLQVLPIKRDGNFAHGILPGTENCVRLYPHRLQGEGHFTALLQKGEGERTASVQSHRRREKLPEDMTMFMTHIHKQYDPNRFMILKDKVLYLPEEELPYTGMRTVRSGLLFGTLKKGRFEPSQHLAMSLSTETFDRTVSFAADDPRTEKYLRGETVETETDGNGWVLVCTDGYPLGFGRCSGTVIKNRIDPGVRKL